MKTSSTVQNTRQSLDNIHILHVDDEPSVSELTAEFLTRENDRFHIHTESGASGGLEYLEENDVDCIVSDYEMPRMNGIEFLKAVRREYSGLPFILFTGRGSEEVASEAISAGVTDYLQKERGVDQYTLLANRIQNAVHRQRATSDLERKIEEQEIVTTLGQEALANASVERLLERAIEEVTKILDVEYAKILEYRPDRGDFLLRAGVGWDEEKTDISTIESGRSSQAGYTVEAAESVIVESLSSDDRFMGPPILTEHDVESGISVLIGDNNDPWGVFGLHTSKSRTFTTEDVNFIQNVANVLATAIRHANHRQELRLFREAVEASGHSIYFTDDTGIIEYVNSAFEKTTGYSEAEAVGSPPSILKSGVHGNEYYQNLWSTILAGETWHNEITNETKTGERYVADQTIAPVMGESGEIDHFVAVNAQITDKVRFIEKCRLLHDIIQEIVQADSVDQIAELAVTAIHDVLEMSGNSIWLYGEADETLQPVAWTDETVETADDLPSFPLEESLVWGRFESGEPHHVENASSTQDREESEDEMIVPLDEYGVIFAGSSEQRGYSKTERGLAELIGASVKVSLRQIDCDRELQRQNDRLSVVFDVLTHDILNHINVASGMLRLAKSSGSREDIEQVARAHDRIEKLIEDMKSFIEIDAEIEDLEQVRLSRISRGCWAVCCPTSESASLQVIEDAEIVANESKIKQLFENIYWNACEHAGPDVTVRVGLLDDGFYIADDGPGIPVDDRADVWEPGYTTRDEDRSGLGLAIVKQVVESHGWTVTITESALGGTRFEITGVDIEEVE